MPNLIPGALWQPVDVGNRAARRKGRAVVGHIAVSNSANLRPAADVNTRPADWHLYLPEAGGIIQQIDLDLQSWATRDGNGSVIAWESQGGVTPAGVAAPWSDGQVEAAAFVLAYANETEGVPLDVMPDSRPASRGMGHHGLGIDPWRVSGGELWSSARGKECPGPARKLQVPVIVSRARELRHGSAGSLPVVTPAPAPQPAPAIARPPRIGWTLPAGHYYGNLGGPARSHGGYYASERDEVRVIQQWLIYRGCVDGVPADRWPTSGWADGRWGPPTDSAMTEWHRRYYPGQPFPAQCWADDLARLQA